MDGNLDRGERKSEREAMAFVNELLSCAGELKNNLKSLQHKCEDVDSKLRPSEFAKRTNKVERLKIDRDRSIQIVQEERNQERKDKYWSSPLSMKPLSMPRATPDEIQQKLFTEKKEKSYTEYASVSIKASEQTVQQYEDELKQFKSGKARDRFMHKQELDDLKGEQKGILGGPKIDVRQLSNSLSGWVEQPVGEDIDEPDKKIH